jgi:hypothetical protein
MFYASCNVELAAGRKSAASGNLTELNGIEYTAGVPDDYCRRGLLVL